MSSLSLSSSAAPDGGGARPIIHLGLDVHKESITLAVLPEAGEGPALTAYRMTSPR